jgi:hypothetical protein
MCVGPIEDETTGKARFCKGCIQRFEKWEAAEKLKDLMLALAAMIAMLGLSFWLVRP